MRGGIALANKYKFQFYEHKGELFIHMEIESMTFKGSEGSAMFGDPVELNSHAAIKELLSRYLGFPQQTVMDWPDLTVNYVRSVKQSMQGSSFSFSDADDGCFLNSSFGF